MLSLLPRVKIIEDSTRIIKKEIMVDEETQSGKQKKVGREKETPREKSRARTMKILKKTVGLNASRAYRGTRQQARKK